MEIINQKLLNDPSNIQPIKGYEIICEALVYKVLDIFGKNSLLSMLYQTGAGPGETIAERLKKIYNKEEFGIVEAVQILFNELKNFYSIQIKEIKKSDEMLSVVIENHCFLRSSIENREKLQFGKAFCRVNKGYFEVAFKKLLGSKVKKIDIGFLYNDPEKKVCVEEMKFYLK